MKKFLNILLIIFTVLFIIGSGFMIYCLCVTIGTKLDKNKLNSQKTVLEFTDEKGEALPVLNGYAKSFVLDGEIPAHVKNAFISIEDKRFYKHKGVDYKRILKSAAKNALTFSFKEGASTISQQLIKNTHLSSAKTLNRKLKEIKLAIELEKNYSKDEILSMYLNTIYFGEGCYGINGAAMKYFSEKVENLSVAEGATLAGIIKSPAYYSPLKNPENSLKRRNLVLKCMYEQNYIDEDTYNSAVTEELIVNENRSLNQTNYIKYVYEEVEKLNLPLEDSGKYEIQTFFDGGKQNIINEVCENLEINCDKEIFLMNKQGHVNALLCSANDIKRNVGSIIKPLIVYTPCLEENIISPLTKIEDVKTDFNGYCPSNYKNSYKGFISCENALNSSSNVVAVKLLNYLTPEKALSYAEKMNIAYDKEKDKNLSIALGAFYKGNSLLEITSAYSVFNNDGNYTNGKFISKIISPSGKTVYECKDEYKKVFSEETVSLADMMLKSNVSNGTAKKLRYLNFDVGCKTGTVGNSDGNSDALSVAFTNDDIIGVRLYDENSLSNSITGGTLPCNIIGKILEKIYEDNKPSDFKISEKLKYLPIDCESYYENNELVLADENSDKSNLIYGYFKQNNLPKSRKNLAENVKIKNANILVNSKEISICLCLEKYYDFKVYKISDKKSDCIYDSLISGKTDIVTDKDVNPSQIYEYYIIPYMNVSGKIIEGERYNLGKVKTPKYVPDDWWKDYNDNFSIFSMALAIKDSTSKEFSAF